MSDEDKGFTVKDRRLFDESGESHEDDQPKESQEKAEATQQAPPQEPAPEPEASEAAEQMGQERPGLPPVDFSGLILSLAHATVMHLGQVPDPSGQVSQPEPELARHTIDTIAMLKEKTAGNLTPEEQKLIDTALTELRLAYVQLTR